MTELQTHRLIVRDVFPLLRKPWFGFHVPNGGNRNAVTGAQLKALGTMAGAPDLLLFGPGGRVHCIEVKAARGRVQPSQREFEERCEACGVPYAIARDVTDAVDACRKWGAL